jgi:hypothetical protein
MLSASEPIVRGLSRLTTIAIQLGGRVVFSLGTDACVILKRLQGQHTCVCRPRQKPKLATLVLLALFLVEKAKTIISQWRGRKEGLSGNEGLIDTEQISTRSFGYERKCNAIS